MRNPFIHCFNRYIIQWERLSIENDANCRLVVVLEAEMPVKCFVEKQQQEERYTYIADSRF
jgi:hypothetical protein